MNLMVSSLTHSISHDSFTHSPHDPLAQHMPLIHHGISKADEVLISNVIIWYKTDMEHYSWWFGWCIFSLLIIYAYYINKISKCFIKFLIHTLTHSQTHTHTLCFYYYSLFAITLVLNLCYGFPVDVSQTLNNYLLEIYFVFKTFNLMWY